MVQHANPMILSRPVKPRASRSALIAASVPELVNRTFSSVGTAEMMRSLSSISQSRRASARAFNGCFLHCVDDGWMGVSEDAGPHEQTKSKYLLPSTS